MHLVDTKTIYAKSIDSSAIMPATIERYQESVPNDDLYRLALVSGVYSRFRLDNSLPSDSYERLYRCWIERSVDGAMADLVLVHCTDNQIDGMITMKIEADVAHIGLVSVDEGSQGRGVGTMLIRAVEAHLQSNTTVRHLKVATQWANKPACHLYEKNGFVVEEKTNIYHWWL
ncbi:MAG: GNAT family N-acetyltransferase [Paludibacteraceae bacterium]|nr:GNAT family N-acetyltransferase [Paludibacteraceae bacterium]